MPKIVDPEQRRQTIADATIAVIVHGGVEEASLSNVAAEAGLAIGSVRHYFPSHAEVVTFAMRRLVDRISARVLQAAQPLLADSALDAHQRRTAAEATLSELLPFDLERNQESAAWLALATASRTNPELRPITRELRDGTRAIVRRFLAPLQQRGNLPPEPAALEMETERFAALLDGLTTDAVLHPDRLPAETMRAVLRHHLGSLTEEPQSRAQPKAHG